MFNRDPEKTKEAFDSAALSIEELKARAALIYCPWKVGDQVVDRDYGTLAKVTAVFVLGGEAMLEVEDIFSWDGGPGAIRPYRVRRPNLFEKVLFLLGDWR